MEFEYASNDREGEGREITGNQYFKMSGNGYSLDGQRDHRIDVWLESYHISCQIQGLRLVKGTPKTSNVPQI